MKNKNFYLIILFLIFLMLIYLIPVIIESKKTVKFIAAYSLIERLTVKSSNELNPCLFSEMKLKNNVELKCQVLKNTCNNKIPPKDDIKPDNACAILTFDINSFNKKPNILSSDKKIQDQYQILIYKDSITAIPNSIEDNILHNKEVSFKRKIQNILLFYEMVK